MVSPVSSWSKEVLNLSLHDFLGLGVGYGAIYMAWQANLTRREVRLSLKALYKRFGFWQRLGNNLHR